MTEENQKRRASLLEVEAAVRDALAAQPTDDDPVRCGMVLDNGMERIAGIAYRYMLDHVDRTDTSQCQVCWKPLGDGKAHRIWHGTSDALPANAVLCTECYDSMLASLRTATANGGDVDGDSEDSGKLQGAHAKYVRLVIDELATITPRDNNEEAK